MRPDKNVKCVLEFKEEEVIGVRAAKEAEHVGPHIALVAHHHLIWNQKPTSLLISIGGERWDVFPLESHVNQILKSAYKKTLSTKF